MRTVDLRSDTLTQPTDEMRRVIAGAEVGDDVFGEDPTINTLQDRVAKMLGKEAGLFVPSGTMGNQIAINVHTQPGDEVICEINSHIFNYEGGAPALLSGVQLHPLQGEAGHFTVEQVKAALRPPDHHFPHTRLVVVENTHNRAGGAIFPLEHIKSISTFAWENGLKMHCDGARLWNAHVATGIALAEYGSYFDTISLCLSKGLGAPVGSVLVGSAEDMDRAHRYRKLYGGGMRQAGILAAAGLYALEHNLRRLELDHERAKKLAECLSTFAGVSVDLDATQTNIVIAQFDPEYYTAESANVALQEMGIKAIPFAHDKIRFVTHLNLGDADIEWTIEAFHRIFGEGKN